LREDNHASIAVRNLEETVRAANHGRKNGGREILRRWLWMTFRYVRHLENPAAKNGRAA
jgi:plasmid stability protein